MNAVSLRTLVGISVFWLALSVITDGVTTLVLPHRLAPLAEDHRATLLGLAAFVGLLAGILVQPIAGLFSDRLRERRRTTLLVLGLVVLVPGLALLAGTDGIVPIVVAFALVQLGANIAQAGQQGLIPDLVPRARRGVAAGVKGFADLLGAVVAFAVLGALLAGPGVGAAAAAVAGTAFVCLLITISLVREGSHESRPAHAGRLIDAFVLDLRVHHAFALLVTSRFLFLLGTYMVGRFLLYFVADRLALDAGAAAQTAGSLLAGLTLVTGVAALAGGWAADRWGRKPLMVFGAGASAIGVLLLALAATSAQIFAFGALMAVGSGTFAAANWALATELAPEDEAARFMGLANIGTAGAAAVAGLAGPLVDWGNAMGPGIGYDALFVLAALAFGGSALALRGIARVDRRLPLMEARAG